MEIKTPLRVERTYSQTLLAPPEKVFPLLCPVREVEWVPGWLPQLVLTASGCVEQDCIFVVPDQDRESIWVTTQWHPDQFFVEFIKVIPNYTVGKIRIQLETAASHHTTAHVTYTFTALTPEGARYVDTFTQARYNTFMQEWETQLNQFLLEDNQPIF